MLFPSLERCGNTMASHDPSRPLAHQGSICLSRAGSIAVSASQPDSENRGQYDLPQTPVSGCEGGRRGATSTSGPDDSKGMRCRVDRRSDTRRSHRSHGPRPGSSLSRGEGKQ
jgi:hypothetical protein